MKAKVNTVGGIEVGKSPKAVWAPIGVEAFDEVVFSQPLKVVHGPVKTSFGYHLIEIIEREESVPETV